MNSIVLSGVICSAFILLGDLGVIVDVTNVTVLVAMVLINLSALIIIHRRYSGLKDRKYFRMPLGPVIPLAGIVSCLILIAFIPPLTLALGIITILSGLILFLLEDTPSGKKAILEIRARLGYNRNKD